MTNIDFHNMYQHMLNKKVKVILNNDYEIIGYFNDEFYDDNSILLNNGTIITLKIEAIKSMELIEK